MNLEEMLPCLVLVVLNPALSHLITSDMNFPHHYMALVQIVDTHNTDPDDDGSKRSLFLIVV